VFFVVYSFLKPKAKDLDFILSCFYFSLYSLFSSPFPSPFTALLNDVSLRGLGERLQYINPLVPGLRDTITQTSKNPEYQSTYKVFEIFLLYLP